MPSLPTCIFLLPCFCFFCLSSTTTSSTFLFHFTLCFMLSYSLLLVCNFSFQNNEKKYFSSIGCMFSFYRRLMFFRFSFLLVCFFCSVCGNSVLPERCVSVSVGFLLPAVGSYPRISLCDQYFLFLFGVFLKYFT